ncbi:MAG: hypothetical protein V1874_13195 [Spirochaetota bacterium]
MSKFKLILLFIFILFLTIIVLQNPNAISLRFLMWNFELSPFAIPAIIVISIILGYLLASIKLRKRNKKE